MQEAGVAQWRIFMEEPARYAAPAALRRCFDGDLSEKTCVRLQGTERLHPRLSGLMRADLPEAVEADAIPEADRRIALLGAGDLETIALRAGAILCASGLAGTIAGPRASAIREALGGETIMTALANRALSDADVDLTAASDIRAFVRARGMAVLAGWSEPLPDAVRARIGLKLPELADPQSADIEPFRDARLSELIEKASS